MPLPGRLPNEKELDGMKLPSDMTKVSLHREYVNRAEQEDTTHVGLTTFKTIWQRYVPEISIMRPAKDVCLVCQQNAEMLRKCAGFPPEYKEAKQKVAQAHRDAATKQRDNYNAQCAMAKSQDLETRPETMVYSFDYAQNVVYPYNPEQPGPAYFSTPRRCGLFGVLCEGTNEQITYLIDEQDQIGKGTNSVLSMVHHYLDVYGHKEDRLKLHAGQNKNNATLGYMLWRVEEGLSKSVELSFMMTGHTKFGPDRMFGMFRKVYNLTEVETLDEIQACFSKSSPSGLNKSISTYDPTREVRHVTWYDWASFLSRKYKPLQGLLGYQNFRTTDVPGTIAAKERVDRKEESFSLLKSQKSFPKRYFILLQFRPRKQIGLWGFAN